MEFKSSVNPVAVKAVIQRSVGFLKYQKAHKKLNLYLISATGSIKRGTPRIVRCPLNPTHFLISKRGFPTFSEGRPGSLPAKQSPLGRV